MSDFPSDAVVSSDQIIARLSQSLRDAEARIRELERLVYIDELTRVLNRRGFRQELARCAAYATRYEEPATLVLLDVDSFKQVNDTYGHPAGDAVLAQVANVLNRTVRASDIVARLGGDEFALILMHAQPEGARRLADNLQRRVREAPASWGGQIIPVEVTAGVAPILPNRAPEEAMEAADRDLYAAKRSRKALAV
ncbi:GGDEF domain-containing protein [Alsobacter sp. SYSU M60028]|uniref:diguanylate cyclase n=1 Tax=Alsobacter ponti TaxID=2962936 RepID=A0ABT1LE80_9HYPH|nr:GGDEF domain-containing protein [Alsobacter ponti]MCP8939794.1 GGDEF domain-containing protein [Alsobacter ponti]